MQITFKDENEKWNPLTGNEIVSMNMFTFMPSVFNNIEKYFKQFMNDNKENIKAEFFMPSVVDKLIKGSKIKVKVLETNANWFGLTYPEDKSIVKEKILNLVKKGIYPKKLWT